MQCLLFFFTNLADTSRLWIIKKKKRKSCCILAPLTSFIMTLSLAVLQTRIDDIPTCWLGPDHGSDHRAYWVSLHGPQNMWQACLQLYHTNQLLKKQGNSMRETDRDTFPQMLFLCESTSRSWWKTYKCHIQCTNKHHEFNIIEITLFFSCSPNTLKELVAMVATGSYKRGGF